MPGAAQEEPLRTLLFVTLCVGCADRDLGAARTLDLGLGTDGTIDPMVTDALGNARWTLEGTLEEADTDARINVSGLADAAAGDVIQLRDANDQRWWVRVGTGDGDGILAAIPAEGAATVVFVEEQGWSNDHAVVITDATGVVLAAEEGWSADLGDALPGIEIASGDVYGPPRNDGCGRRRAVELLSGDTAVRIGERAPVAGGELVLENVGAWTFSGPVRCTDVWGPSPWLLTRAR